MQFHFHAHQSHFHKNGFALILPLKQRQKGTRKFPIRSARSSYANEAHVKHMIVLSLKCTGLFKLRTYIFFEREKTIEDHF